MRAGLPFALLRNEADGFRMRPALYFFLLYSGLILYLCLFPWSIREGGSTPWLIFHLPESRGDVADLLLNIAFFIPFGVSGGIAFRGRLASILVFVLSVMLSGSVESLQTMLQGRVSSLLDLGANVTGALIGVAGSRVADRFLISLSAGSPSRTLNYPPALLLGFFFVGELFPFIPHYRVPHLKQVWDALPRVPEPIAALSALILFATVPLLLRRLFDPPLRWPLWISPALVLALLILVSRPLFASRQLTGLEWLVAIVGIAAGASLPQPFLLWTLGFALPGLLVLRELHPFTFLTEAQSFEWTPFRALFDLNPAYAIRLFGEKMFFYSATIYFLVCRKWTILLATTAVLGVLAVGEALQRYLPGRTPETTDLAMAGIAGLLLWLTKSQQLISKAEAQSVSSLQDVEPDRRG